MKRRLFLKEILTTSVITAFIFLSPSSVAEWEKEAFNAKSFDTAMAAIGGNQAKDSDKIYIAVPDIAENGHIVPISITTTLQHVSQIHVLIKENTSPLTASFTFSELTVPTVKSRVKVAKKSEVVAVVKAGGKMYKATANVNVTIGGCGG